MSTHRVGSTKTRRPAHGRFDVTKQKHHEQLIRTCCKRLVLFRYTVLVRLLCIIRHKETPRSHYTNTDLRRFLASFDNTSIVIPHRER